MTAAAAVVTAAAAVVTAAAAVVTAAAVFICLNLLLLRPLLSLTVIDTLFLMLL